MGWIEQINGKTVGLDSAPVIHFIERHPSYLSMVRPFFRALDAGEFMVITSMITLLEMLVLPLRQDNRQLASEYRDVLFNSRGSLPLPLSQEIAEEAARIRAIHGVRTPDAIQIATALHGGASFFLTNDARLPAVPGLRMLVLDQLECTQ